MKMELGERISNWILDYSNQSKLDSLVVGVSGGIDSALVSTLCAMTGKRTILLSLPIYQNSSHLSRAEKHIKNLKSRYKNIESYEFDLSDVLEKFLVKFENKSELSEANTRSRIRMITLYHIASLNNGLVVGTGNKVEDFGVGFYTKYGDGGVDISPIADCNKSEVWEMGKELGILNEIIEAAPTDGLWDDGRTDEGQLGFKYHELEEAMENSNSKFRSEYEKIRKQNLHKMEPIPVCKIPR